MGGESSYAVLFPGQGSQAVGMAGELARAFPQARRALELAEQAVPGLVELMQKGPEDELRRTSNAQPALLAAGLACWWVWQELCRRPPAALAGHSLGEYTALAAAQALAAEDALRAVRLRGELMEQAMEPGKGGMAAVMGLQDEDVVQLCQQACQNLGEPAAVVAANFNAPGQVVVSGTSQGLQEVQSLV
ncbi:MAG TPA: ACP S-malonyltransferase, partial [Limnochordales bacterium]